MKEIVTQNSDLPRRNGVNTDVEYVEMRKISLLPTCRNTP